MCIIYRMLSLALKWVQKSVRDRFPPFMLKIVFSDNVEWSSKNLGKMMSADVKISESSYLSTSHKRI